jgi:hypothetical protein
MARGKRNTQEQIVSLLRQIEVAVASGKATAQACKEAANSPAKPWTCGLIRTA